MPEAAQAEGAVRFGVFELDLRSGELRRQGVKIKLQDQPFRVLAMLLEHPGEMVTREELRTRLWPENTFVEFEHCLATDIKKVREALDDSADNPRFVETLPKRGYRFIAPVETARRAVSVPETLPGAVPLRKHRLTLAVTGGLVAALGIILVFNLAGLRDRLLATLGARHGVPPPKIESIAVLPLENLSRDPDQEYFADGMTDALITDLGQISALRVISRTSTMQYKGTKKPLPEIARELNVDAVVEGTVQRSGSRVRITAQLLQASTDRHLWAEAYDRDLRDVLSLQSEIANAIARQVQAKLTPHEQTRLASAPPVNPEALDLYLKGADWLLRSRFHGAVPGQKNGLEYFQQVIQKDPNFARGYLGLARTYLAFGTGEVMAPHQAFPKAKAYARKALELDESLAEAHATLASSLDAGDWNWSGAEDEFKRAFELNPNSSEAHWGYSWHLMQMGRMEEAIAEGKRFQELSPALALPYHPLAIVYFFARRYDEAVAQCRKGEEIDPQTHYALVLGWVYREKGKYKEAIAEFLKMPDGVVKFGHLGNAYARAGNRAEAHKAIQGLSELTKQGLGNYAVALVYSGLDEKNRAVEWLEKAYKAHDKGMCFLKVDPALDPLRSDPRFRALLRKMNLQD